MYVHNNELNRTGRKFGSHNNLYQNSLLQLSAYQNMKQSDEDDQDVNETEETNTELENEVKQAVE